MRGLTVIALVVVVVTVVVAFVIASSALFRHRRGKQISGKLFFSPSVKNFFGSKKPTGNKSN